MARGTITLTTDFGPDSPYVAQMKGAMLRIAPDVMLVDVTHSIPAQHVGAGAIVLDDVCRHFAAGTVHVAVVDPGVGTSRSLVAARMGGQTYLAPDNGLLGLVASRVAPTHIVRLTNARYWAAEVSATFHGRDILGPVAAHCVRGVPLVDLGERQDILTPAPLALPCREPGCLRGICWLVDHFGNLISNIDRSWLEVPGQRVREIRVGHTIVPGLVRTYGESASGSLVALIGSHGRLEVAVVRGNAAQRLGTGEGTEIRVFLADGELQEIGKRE